MDNRFDPHMAVTVLAKLMNTMVVSLMSEQMHGMSQVKIGVINSFNILFISIHKGSGRLLCVP